MYQHNISKIAYLVAEPARAIFLITLSDGYARSASELAEAGGVTAQTASSHLAKLLHGGLLRVESKGRHRYYSLAGEHVPRVLESLASVGPVTPAWCMPPNKAAREMRFARCCYNHFAGQVAVAITKSMVEREYLEESNEYTFFLTQPGRAWMREFDVEMAASTDEQLRAYRCLDWTERQYHVAGPLGVRLMGVFSERGWLQRSRGTRAVTVTPAGWAHFREHFGITRDMLLHVEAPLVPTGLAV